MVKLFVEGGGNTSALKTACRSAFRAFLEKAGLAQAFPRIVACGGRKEAYDSYRTAIANGELALLLIDSEAEVDASHQQDSPDKWKPWQHLKLRQGDGWDKPPDAADTDCHLMTQCMESWFLADRKTLADFFGQGFNEKQLPAHGNSLESIPKTQVYKSLENASRDCRTKSQYGKGEHSFKLLSLIDASKVTNASPWAKRFVDELRQKMNSTRRH